jgi:ATP-binding cassette subfamily C protein CydC
VPGWLLGAARARGAAAQERDAGLRAATLDAVDCHADMVALHAQAQTHAHFERLCQTSARARASQARVAARGQWFLQAAAGLSLVALLWFCLAQHEAGALEGPLLAGLLLAVIGIFEVAGPIMRGASRMGSALSAAQRIRDVAQREPDMRDPAAPSPLPRRGALEVVDLTFAYPARSAEPPAPLLRDLRLRVEPGERVAILGESGVGKSTLLHLLLRLEDPLAGQVRYADVDARACAQADWHRRIALLSQDAPVFLGTLRTNLLIGDPQADDATLWRALDAARLGEFVRGLPDGLDTWTGETGSQLSAGQARRLCLARALLSPAEVIVLDEPTAGLDGAAEAAFFADLGQAVQGRTVVLATHAALPAGAVDRCCILRGGQLHDVSSAMAILA